eukprot:TRINITY_DN3413_c0_g1_i4.p1 TRINITY_DN3413_c0_g1~~TRINITY_DN3413_c0_g1_i4.p1  ORF type:complete len:1342 (+),score=317.88 TRINITY_DN3413_c0_g1_i4:442-4026(+)
MTPQETEKDLKEDLGLLKRAGTRLLIQAPESVIHEWTFAHCFPANATTSLVTAWSKQLLPFAFSAQLLNMLVTSEWIWKSKKESSQGVKKEELKKKELKKKEPQKEPQGSVVHATVKAVAQTCVAGATPTSDDVQNMYTALAASIQEQPHEVAIVTWQAVLKSLSLLLAGRTDAVCRRVRVAVELILSPVKVAAPSQAAKKGAKKTAKPKQESPAEAGPAPSPLAEVEAEAVGALSVLMDYESMKQAIEKDMNFDDRKGNLHGMLSEYVFCVEDAGPFERVIAAENESLCAAFDTLLSSLKAANATLAEQVEELRVQYDDVFLTAQVLSVLKAVHDTIPRTFKNLHTGDVQRIAATLLRFRLQECRLHMESDGWADALSLLERSVVETRKLVAEMRADTFADKQQTQIDDYSSPAAELPHCRYWPIAMYLHCRNSCNGVRQGDMLGADLHTAVSKMLTLADEAEMLRHPTLAAYCHEQAVLLAQRLPSGMLNDYAQPSSDHVYDPVRIRQYLARLKAVGLFQSSAVAIAYVKMARSFVTTDSDKQVATSLQDHDVEQQLRYVRHEVFTLEISIMDMLCRRELVRNEVCSAILTGQDIGVKLRHALDLCWKRYKNALLHYLAGGAHTFAGTDKFPARSSNFEKSVSLEGFLGAAAYERWLRSRDEGEQARLHDVHAQLVEVVTGCLASSVWADLSALSNSKHTGAQPPSAAELILNVPQSSSGDQQDIDVLRAEGPDKVHDWLQVTLDSSNVALLRVLLKAETLVRNTAAEFDKCVASIDCPAVKLPTRVAAFLSLKHNVQDFQPGDGSMDMPLSSELHDIWNEVPRLEDSDVALKASRDDLLAAFAAQDKEVYVDATVKYLSHPLARQAIVQDEPVMLVLESIAVQLLPLLTTASPSLHSPTKNKPLLALFATLADVFRDICTRTPREAVLRRALLEHAADGSAKVEAWIKLLESLNASEASDSVEALLTYVRQKSFSTELLLRCIAAAVVVYHRNGDTARQLELLAEVVTVHSHSQPELQAEAMLALATKQLTFEQFDKAKATLQQAVRLEVSQSLQERTLRLQASLYRQMKDHTMELQVLQQLLAVQVNPRKIARSHIALAYTLLNLNRPKDGYHSLCEALLKCPANDVRRETWRDYVLDAVEAVCKRQPLSTTVQARAFTVEFVNAQCGSRTMHMYQARLAYAVALEASGQ